MQRFSSLFFALDATTSTKQKVKLLTEYFEEADPADAVWALSLLIGNRLKRFISSRDLHNAARQLVDLPDWLYEESYRHVGDSAELISLLLADSKPKQNHLSEISLSGWLYKKILPLKALDKEEQLEQIVAWWSQLNRNQLFILNKLLTGGFRVGVSKTLVIRALSESSGIDTATLTHRLMGSWEPSEAFYRQLLAPSSAEELAGKPYPFYLAYPLEENAELSRQLGGRESRELTFVEWDEVLEPSLGPPEAWQIEWKWDGIRCQLVKQGSTINLWSRGEELINEQFPELLEAAQHLPETLCLDGEILAYQDTHPLHFSVLQKRLGRKKPSASLIKKAPVVFMAYDLLHYDKSDKRQRTQAERRAELESLLANLSDKHFILSSLVTGNTWADLAQQRQDSRELGVEGFMLKRRDSAYGVGRKKGDWWKWKIEPYTIDAVMLYAQPGSGRRANLYTDYTFGVWKPDEEGELRLVPVAKAYSGLTDKEIRAVDKWIRQNTTERFGPVRQVKPQLVFELAFEGISRSKRHKSGVALRFPRMHRWRQDKPAEEASTLENLESLIEASSPGLSVG